MLTLNEIAVTALAVIGIAFNAYIVVRARTDKPGFDLFVLLYALFVVVPQLMVCLYAFTHFQAD